MTATAPQTLGDRLDSFKGYGPGFDALRVVLALSILWYHSFVIVGSMHEVGHSPLWFFSYMRMPMFFALSGFLVAASALRTSLIQFLLNRLCRIIPALAVCVALSALLLGALYTTLPLPDYFTHPLFYRYFANIILWTQYTLPGIFPDHPSHGVVNLSIWSLPFEYVCYAFIFASMALKTRGYHPQAVFALALLMLLLPVAAQELGHTGANRKTQFTLLNYAFFTRGSLLFPSFLLGACLYWWRYRIPYSRALAAGCMVFCFAMGALGSEKWRHYYLLNLFSVPVLAYLTAFIGCTRLPKLPFFSTGDYSYGIYLYGYPIQQAIFSSFPAARHWLPHYGLSLLFVVAAAVLSWHFVEKPIVRWRKNYTFAARRVSP